MKFPLTPFFVYIGFNFLRLGIPCFIVLCRYYVFYKLRICGNPVWSKSISTIFPPVFAYFISVVLVILSIFETFSLLLHLSSVIFDVTINTIIVLEHHEPCPFKTVNLISKCVCSDHSIYLSPSSQAFLFPETQ